MLPDQKTNIELLNQYYNCITNKRVFENILDFQNNLYFYPRIQKWKLNQNNILLKNEYLQTRIELLTIYNSLITRVMGTIVVNFKSVNEWKKSNNNLHENELKIRLGRDLRYLKDQYPYIIKLNKSSNLLLACKIKEYCINLIDIMITYLKIDLCIDLVKSPLYPSIQKLIIEVENTIDKTINNEQEPQQNKTESQIKAVTQFSFNNEFDNVNSKFVFEYFKKELVDKNYLSLDDLEKYLKLSFEKKELPDAKFILKQNRTLKVIRVIFYNYFRNIAYKPNGRQSEYIKLLTDYFQGFEYEKVKNNFNK